MRGKNRKKLPVHLMTGWIGAGILICLMLCLAPGQTVIAADAASETDDSLRGEISLSQTGEPGGITEQNNCGFRFSYQIYNETTNPKQVCISGYTYEEIRADSEKDKPVELKLPSKIIEGETHTEYDVVGVNGGVFEGFRELYSLKFGSTYQWIQGRAFMNSNLASVILNPGMRSIDKNAFYGCPWLTEVHIGADVNFIGDGAFANCKSLGRISVASDNPFYCAENDVLYKKGTNNKIDELVQWPAALMEGTSLVTSCTIGSADCPVRFVRNSAFEGCTNLGKIDGFYPTVTTIGERAFAGCSSLYSVKIPNTVVLIGDQAFSGCSSALTVDCNKDSYAEIYARNNSIPTSVTCTVRFYDGDTLLKTEEVPYGTYATAPSVGERDGYTLTWDKDYTNVKQNLDVHISWKQNYTVTFKDAHSGQVTQVATYYGGAATPPVWTRQGYILGWDTTTYNYVTKDLTVNAVWLVSMTDTPITEEKPKIGDTRTIGYITYQVTRATASDPRVKAVSCTKPTLTSVTIPATITFGGTKYRVTNIGTNAFRSMPKLTKLTIGKNVVKINRAAFYNCPKLKTITISSKKLSSVVEKAFSKTYVKAKVNVPNAYIKKYKSYLQDAGLSVYAKVY